jgi:hypothetical protein
MAARRPHRGRRRWRPAGEGEEGDGADGDPVGVPQRVACLVDVAGGVEHRDRDGERLRPARHPQIAQRIGQPGQRGRRRQARGGGQGGGQLARRPDALALALAQAAVHQPGERVGDAGHPVAQGRHLLVEVHRARHQLIVAERRERVLVGDQHEEDESDRPDIGAGVDLVHAVLLRRHVRQGADHRARRA